MRNELKDILRDAFYAPEPENKKDFLRNIRPREVSVSELLLQQVSYIGAPVWLFEAVIIIFAIGGSLMMVETTESIITMAMPFTASIAVIEAKRSKRCGMTELEMATRFSLRTVVFARMMILGVVSVIILCVASPVIAAAFNGTVLLTGVHILIPYLITMIISLRVERSALGRRTGYSSLAVAGLVAVIFYWLSNFEPEMTLYYLSVIESWGILIAVILLTMTIAEQWKTINNLEAFA